MSTYSTTVGLYGGFTHTLSVTTASQDIANNRSVINIVYWMTKNNSGTSYGTSSWSVTVNGQSFGGSATFSMTQGQSFTFLSKQITVTHNPDGTKSFSAAAHFDGLTDYCPAASVSGAYTVATIPRKSDFDVPTFTAGTAGTITIHRASTSFTHTITYAFVNASGTIATKTSSTTLTWTPPLAMLQQMTNATQATAGWIKVETFSGSTSLGIVQHNLTLTAGSDAVPSVGALTIAESTAAVKTLLGSSAGTQFVQGVSTITLGVNAASGYQGSTITGITATIGTASPQSVSTPTGSFALTPQDSGSVPLTVTVTDTRGRTATSTQTLTVIAYTPPTLSSIQARRATSAGTLSDQGTNIRVDLTANASSVKPKSSELNRMAITLATATSGGTTFTTDKTVSVRALSATSPITTTKSTYSVDASWSVLVTVADALTSSQALLTVATATVFMHWDGKDGIGVGKYRENGSVDAAGDVYARGGLLCPPGSVTAYAGTTAPAGWLLCDGSYYAQSAYAALYAVLGGVFGATSTTFAVPDLRGRVPIGVSAIDTDFASTGATGGEKAHTLTVSEMPSHNHGQVVTANSGGTGIRKDYAGDATGLGRYDQGVNTNTTGGGGSHNNLQPYIVLNYIIRT